MKIKEMTMRGPNYDKLATKLANEYSSIWKTGKYIADIEQFKVLMSDSLQVPGATTYTLWNENKLVAFASVINENEVDGVWVDSEYRGQKILSKLLWFFKTRLNKSPLILGDIHSTDMQEVVKGLSRFEKKWFNIKTKEVEPFNVETLDKYYSFLKPTNWRLMLENDGEFNWPMFKTGVKFMQEDYTEIIK
jgi:hypothetical protein